MFHGPTSTISQVTVLPFADTIVLGRGPRNLNGKRDARSVGPTGSNIGVSHRLLISRTAKHRPCHRELRIRSQWRASARYRSRLLLVLGGIGMAIESRLKMHRVGCSGEIAAPTPTFCEECIDRPARQHAAVILPGRH